MPSFLAPKDYTRQWVRFQGLRRALYLSDLTIPLHPSAPPLLPSPKCRSYKKSLNIGNTIVCHPLPLPCLLGWPCPTTDAPP